MTRSEPTPHAVPVLRTALVLTASLVLASCATCPPVDEETIARRVVDELERTLSGSASTEDVLASLPYDEIPRRGPADARVRVVVISDFECPYCGEVVPQLERLREEYGDSVAFYFLHYPLPFHPHARTASEAAIEAYEQGGDEAFYRMHDVLFANRGALLPEDLVGYGVTLGLDGEAIRRAITDEEHDARIARDMALADRLGLTGTPLVFVGEERIEGAERYATYRAAVERALGR